MSLFTIHRVHAKAKCYMSGKEREAIEFSSGDDEARVVVALNEFIKLVRMELRKAEHAGRRPPIDASK